MVVGSLIVIGHFGHWYISLPVYLGPALAIVLWLWLGDRRERSRAASAAPVNDDSASDELARASGPGAPPEPGR
ncbi:hypothetical protein [Thermoleophilum album]|uniref:Uncharacterized protein n=1 Tax=Thermoleophilum album TaxID=29539 RepID=A0A1H6FJI6_THEAL|nr:hypothetical protein [Thermoleophilum album]SEH10562.1 hypothetical protein SAMN02745716_0426 [Thermoleophilum album]